MFRYTESLLRKVEKLPNPTTRILVSEKTIPRITFIVILLTIGIDRLFADDLEN